MRGIRACRCSTAAKRLKAIAESPFPRNARASSIPRRCTQLTECRSFPAACAIEVARPGASHGVAEPHTRRRRSPAWRQCDKRQHPRATRSRSQAQRPRPLDRGWWLMLVESGVPRSRPQRRERISFSPTGAAAREDKSLAGAGSARRGPRLSGSLRHPRESSRP